MYGASTATNRGAPVWDSTGAFVGIVDSGAGDSLRVLPVASVASSFTSLIDTGVIRHAFLGVRGLDLSLVQIDGDRGGLPLRGILLRDDRHLNKPAVSKDSPAAKAGLKIGDVILDVERDILDGTIDLGELLSEYRPNTMVTLRIWRNGKELDVPVTLGSIVTGEVVK